MAMDMDSFERELMSYSEFTGDGSEPPTQLVDFYNRMEKNDNSSLYSKQFDFDDIEGSQSDGSESEPHSSSKNMNNNNHRKKNNDYSLSKALNEQEKDQLTYSSVGRGRGSRKTFFQPGVSHEFKLTDAEEIQRRIRQTSGLGYSNELIEANIKSVQKENQEKNQTSTRNSPRIATPSGLERNSRDSTPTGSRTSSIVGFSSPKPGANSPRSDINSIKNEVSPRNLNSPQSNSNTPNYLKSPSKFKLLPSENELFSDASSDSYYTIQETSNELTTSSRKSDDISLTEGEIEEDTNIKVQQDNDIKEEPSNENEKKSDKPELSKPMSLTAMLKIARAEKKLAKKVSLNPLAKPFESKITPNPSLSSDTTQETSSSSSETKASRYLTESEEAKLSEQLIKKLLQEDRLELEAEENKQPAHSGTKVTADKKRKTQEDYKQRQLRQHSNWLNRHYQSRHENNSPNSGSSSSDDQWRRNTGSPPRHNWNQRFNLKPLNINSVEEFPTLK